MNRYSRLLLIVFLISLFYSIISVYAACCMVPEIVKQNQGKGCLIVNSFRECVIAPDINESDAIAKKIYSPNACATGSNQLCYDFSKNNPPGACCQEDCTTVAYLAECQDRQRVLEAPCTPDNCRVQLGAQLSTISGYVKTTSDAPISGASVKMRVLSTTTNAQGFYSLPGIAQGQIPINVSKSGYKDKVETILVQSPIYEHNITLGTFKAELAGFIKDSQNRPISGALISILGALPGTSDASGKFSVLDINPGTYTISVSHSEYVSYNEEVTFVDASSKIEKNFILQKASRGFLDGTVYANESTLAIDEARVYVNDKFTAVSNSQGKFNLLLDMGSEQPRIFNVKLTKPYYLSAEKFVQITKDETKSEIFYLFPESGFCGYPRSAPVSKFNASHVPGAKAVQLFWEFPQECENIAGFNIYKKIGAEFKPIKYVPVFSSFLPTTYRDEDVKWNTPYEYEIRAVYLDIVPRESTPLAASITTGDPSCENRYMENINPPRMAEFCISNKRTSCSLQNKVTTIEDCGGSRACAGPNDIGKTSCRDKVCAPDQQNAGALGYYFTKEGCLAGSTYCYYDYSDTPVDQCYSCDKVKTCFDYRSNESCTINNCEAGNMSRCEYAFTAPEVGKGICYQVGYKGANFCSKCSTEEDILGAGNCSQNVCSKLGKCFSNDEETSCFACTPQVYCSQYKRETSCSGGQNSQIVSVGDTLNYTCGKIIDNKNACENSLCRWSGSSCFKDGNFDTVADCNPGENCEKDNIPPLVNFTVVPFVANVNSTLLVTTPDALKVKYCVAKRGLNPIDCCPQIEGKELSFIAGKVNIPLYDNQTTSKRGEYILKFYATDPNGNRNQLSLFPYGLDPSGPNITGTATPMIPSSLKVEAFIDEPVKCTDNLVSQQVTVPPLLGNQTQYKTYYSFTYTNVPDGVFTFTLNCLDTSGNKGVFVQRDIIMNNFINIVQPKGPQPNENTIFIAKTLGEADCSLKKYNETLQQLSTVDGITHTSNSYVVPINMQINEYFADCKLRRDASLTAAKNFSFAVDQFPPETIVFFNNDQTTVRDSGWEVFFDTATLVGFKCDLVFTSGYNCTETKFCTVSGENKNCPPPPFSIYRNPISYRNTTSFCYYSTDAGTKNNIESPKCGTLYIGDPIVPICISPRNCASTQKKFDLVFQTNRITDSCSWATEINKNAPFSDNFKYIPLEKLTNYTASTYVLRNVDFTSFTTPEAEQIYYIKCRDNRGKINEVNPSRLVVKYDTTPPKITSMFFKPNPVVDDQFSILSLQSDDPTVCRYDDKSVPYLQMGKFFAGYLQSNYYPTHSYNQSVNSNDNGKTLSFFSICENEAGLQSDISATSVQITLDAAPNIIGTSPFGYTRNTSVIYQVLTSRSGSCLYASTSNSTAITPFDFKEENKRHYTNIKTVSSGLYSHPVSCNIQGLTGTVIKADKIEFTVDIIPPTLQINFSYTCSDSEIIPSFIPSDNFGIKEFEYTILKGNTSLVPLTRTTESRPIISVKTDRNSSYLLKAKAYDLASNFNPEISQIFTLLPGTDPRCSEKIPPVIKYSSKEGCGETAIDLQCTDEGIGCSLVKYDVKSDQSSCMPFTTFNSASPIKLTQSSYICYYAEDVLKNKVNDSFFIQFNSTKSGDSDRDGVADCNDLCPNIGGMVGSNGCTDSSIDSDGDGIPDDKDKCPRTLARYLPTVMLSGPDIGCSPDEIDSDQDGLPDVFENLYLTACEINMNQVDTNLNAITDNLEDCDSDNFSNYEEWLSGTDPSDPDDYPGKYSQQTVKEDIPEIEEEKSLLPIILLLIGILFVLSGISYLSYKRYYPVPVVMQKPEVKILIKEEKQVQKPKEELKTLSQELEKRKDILKRRRDARRITRQELFGSFGGKETVIKSTQVKETVQQPSTVQITKEVRVEKIEETEKSYELPKASKEAFEKLAKLSKGVKTEGEFDKLALMASQHLSKKENLHPVMRELKKSESKVFEKLAKISEKRLKEGKGLTKQDIKQAVPKKDAEKIFKKISKVSKK